MQTTRDRIVDATAKLFQRHGYHATGLKLIAKESRAPVGSLYHFFPGGKAQLAAETIRLSGYGYQLLVEGVVDSEVDLVSGVRAAFDVAADVLAASDYADACPIATVALEIASSDEILRQATAEVFESWLVAITRRAVAAGIDENASRHLAYLFVAALEGGFLLSRAAKDTAPMRSLGSSVVAALEAALARV